MNNEQIARVAHEANRALCLAQGDTSQKPWDGCPEWQKKSAWNGVDLHRKHPDTGESESHTSWLKEKEADGWVYGPEKDAEKKTHPCMVHYDDLPADQKLKDFLFCAVVRTLLQTR